MAENQNYDSDLLEGTYQLALKYCQDKDWPNAVEWLSKLAKRAPKYRDTVSLLEDAEKQLNLATLYKQGRQALDAKDWETAHATFQKVLNIDPDYEQVKELYSKAHKEIELPKLYNQAMKQWHTQDWDRAIETLSAILDLDPHYKDVPWLLEKARQKKRLEEDYQWALQQCAKAEKTGQESDWREAAVLLQKIADEEPGYRTVSPKLAHAQRRLEFFELSRKGKEHYDHAKWQEAIAHLKQATELDSRDSDLVAMLTEAQDKLHEQKAARQREMLELYNKGNEHYRLRKWKEAVAYLEDASIIEPDYADLPTKLGEARKKLKEQKNLERWRRAIALAWAALCVVFAIAVAIFPDRFAAAGKTLEKTFGGGASTTPTSIIPIHKIDVFMNGDQLNLDQSPSLTSGQPVELEIIVFDTKGKRYTSDDLVCKWSVNPLGDNDERIDTELCKVPYRPSQEYPQQVVILEDVEGLEQQFEPIDPIPMIFDIE